MASDNPFVNLVELPGDKIKRDFALPCKEANCDPNGTSSVITKDVDIDTDKKTWARIYIPRGVTKACDKKLPVIFYYHGGGFVLFHANDLPVSEFVELYSEITGAVVISLEYRLAPENRLPAAYDDAIDGLNWIKNTQDEWIRNYADLSQVYLTGTSAGGNMAYQAGLRVAASPEEYEPLKIKGLILHQPYFSGKTRTESEERLKDNELLPLHAIHKMFDLSLPKGADYDHEYCNPWANGGSKHLKDIKALGWKVMVTGVFQDPLVDAGRGFAKLMEENGIKTVRFFEEGHHIIECLDESRAKKFFEAIRDFVLEE